VPLREARRAPTPRALARGVARAECRATTEPAATCEPQGVHVGLIPLVVARAPCRPRGTRGTRLLLKTRISRRAWPFGHRGGCCSSCCSKRSACSRMHDRPLARRLAMIAPSVQGQVDRSHAADGRSGLRVGAAGQHRKPRGPGPNPPLAAGTDGRYGAGVAAPVMASGGSTRMASRTAGSWPSLRISPATKAGI
jgi:hypothetical protein